MKKEQRIPDRNVGEFDWVLYVLHSNRYSIQVFHHLASKCGGNSVGWQGNLNERTLCFERRGEKKKQTSQLKERDSPARSCKSQKRTTGREEKTVDAFLAIAVVGLSGSADCAPIVLSQVSCTLPQASDSFPFAAVFFSSIST